MALISPLSIAPMIDWTYTHFRVFMRLLAPHALLYTDMQTAGAICHNPQRVLSFNPIEQPLALQLGGSDKKELRHCAKLAEERGFAEINLNLGCPSYRVQAGQFGACLMAKPQQVTECIAAMKEVVSIPVTAKTRIGIDHQDSYDFFAAFAQELVNAGCDKLVVHARKAWLHGLNPKQNRSIPPLHYDFVYKIKKEYPQLPIVINGNITSIEAISQHRLHVDGVMLGRLACQNPYEIALIHHHLYPESPLRSRHDILNDYLNYALPQFEQGVPLSLLLKPIFNLSHGLPGTKQWKAKLIEIQQNKEVNKLTEILTALQEMKKLPA